HCDQHLATHPLTQDSTAPQQTNRVGMSVCLLANSRTAERRQMGSAQAHWRSKRIGKRWSMDSQLKRLILSQQKPGRNRDGVLCEKRCCKTREDHRRLEEIRGD